MESKLTKLKTLNKITLTDEERNLLRAHAARIVIASPVIITESFFKRGVQHGLRIALSSMLFVIFIAGSVSAVANNALPGDPLYPFKINVNEEVQGLLSGNNPEQKVFNDESLAGNRAAEIQTLAESNSLTQAKQEIAAKALSSNIQSLSTNLAALSAQSPTTALTVTNSLEQTLKATKSAIENTPDSTAGNTGKDAAIKTVDDTLQTVSNQEVQILSNEIDTINSAVITVPTSASTQTAAVQSPTVQALLIPTQSASTTHPTITPAAH